jgi:hypothetical protein
MATYPAVIDSYTPVAGTTLLSSADHANQHNIAGSAIVALENKVGLNSGSAAANQILVGASAGSSSWGSVWNLAQLGTPTIGTPTITGGTIQSAAAIGGTLSTVTGGTANSVTLGTPVVNVGSDATGDLYYRNGGTFTRLPIGSNGQYVTTNGTTPSWAAVSPNTTAKARAFRNTSVQSINSATFTKVQLNGESYDPGNNFDSVTNFRFVAPVTGYYMVTGAVGYATSTDVKRYIASIYVNGSEVAEGGMQASTSATLEPAVSDIILLTATDYVELYTFQESGGAQNINNGTQYTYLSIHLLSI